jgi:hypothetical protein
MVERFFERGRECTHRIFENAELRPNSELLTSIFVFYKALLEATKYLMDKNKNVPYREFDREMERFHCTVNEALTPRLFNSFEALLRVKELSNEEYHCLYSLADFLFALFTQEIRLSNASLSDITEFTL